MSGWSNGSGSFSHFPYVISKIMCGNKHFILNHFRICAECLLKITQQALLSVYCNSRTVERIV